MSKIWKTGLAVVAALALAMAGYSGLQLFKIADQQSATFQYQPATTSAKAAASAVPKAYLPNCSAPANRDDANLCGQWAAVAQATETNRLASLSLRLSIGALIFTVIGTGLLVWTLHETRQTSRRELRAYVSVQPLELHLNGTSGEVQVAINIRNDGSTPAYKLMHMGNVLVADEEGAEREIMRKDERPRIGRPREMSLAVGENKNANVIGSHRNLDGKEMADIATGERSIFAFGSVEYLDTFDIKRVTRFCFRAEVELPNRLPTSRGPIEQQMRWAVAPFYNDST